MSDEYKLYTPVSTTQARPMLQKGTLSKILEKVWFPESIPNFEHRMKFEVWFLKIYGWNSLKGIPLDFILCSKKVYFLNYLAEKFKKGILLMLDIIEDYKHQRIFAVWFKHITLQ